MTNASARMAEIRRVAFTKIFLQFSCIALTLSCSTTGSSAQNNSKTPPLVQTSLGPVQGFIKSGVVQFLGIPYAAPPVGTLRWMPTQPHARWVKPLNAVVYGPTCAQNIELGVFAGPPNNNEDCLYLNVFSPGVKAQGQSRMDFSSRDRGVCGVAARTFYRRELHRAG
jgi:para-nitrobenzyl esterase